MEKAETRTSPSDPNDIQNLEGRRLHRHLLEKDLEADRLQGIRPLISPAYQALGMRMLMN